ncbi:tetratricopeptide repeat protein [Gloeocapsopsis sp. IPPAS B-1203]|uniref:tetratricopeptide repeat protein n=1 Tax=Gloeocapsopsis sp. IPPAS B-1203 TaxID=2049454 RepID=UPI0025A0E69E|nr:tetratricopeptide repeat protein [Gloeocapsopsis sp. IPPAS B-1203]
MARRQSQTPGALTDYDVVLSRDSLAVGETEDVNKVLRHNLESVFYNNQGVARYQAGDFAEALTNYNTAIQLAPNYAIAYYNRGLVYEELQDNQKAISEYNEALKLNPNYAEAYYRRGILRHQLGEADALDDLHQAKDLLVQQGKVDLYQQTVQVIKSID